LAFTYSENITKQRQMTDSVSSQKCVPLLKLCYTRLRLGQ